MHEELTPEVLIEAYRQGIFPWPVGPGLPIPWCSPEERAVLIFKDLHIPRSLEKARRKQTYSFTIDKAFDQVIEHCAKAKRPEKGTWIIPPMIKAYKELHRLGVAHSCEAWEGDRLVGGLYGVDPGGAFCGESMFYLKPDASKLALLYLIEHLRERGLGWIDIQMLTPHMVALGAKAITRAQFLRKLRAALAAQLVLF
jgi:leucyl/phenylalanyl-tRNA--protein transferase